MNRSTQAVCSIFLLLPLLAVESADSYPISATVSFVDQNRKAIAGLPVYSELGAVEFDDRRESITNDNGIISVFYPEKQYNIISSLVFGLLTTNENHYDIVTKTVSTIKKNRRFYRTTWSLKFNFNKNGYTYPYQTQQHTGPATGSVVVREVLDPVPMYACRREATIPAAPGPWGFDLIISDWVAPHGIGQHADMLITLKTDVPWNETAFRNRTTPESGHEWVTVRFPNPGDGIQEFLDDPKVHSEFTAPYTATASGYYPVIRWDQSYGAFKNEYVQRDRRTFVMRLRTAATAAVTVEGKAMRLSRIPLGSATAAIVAKGDCIYGRITGDYGNFWNVRKNSIRFTYYINPNPMSVSLEYDRTRNLYEGRNEIGGFIYNELPP